MMKIAVPVTKENQIDSHFGHCESYGVFTISDKNEIIRNKECRITSGMRMQVRYCKCACRRWRFYNACRWYRRWCHKRT